MLSDPPVIRREVDNVKNTKSSKDGQGSCPATNLDDLSLGSTDEVESESGHQRKHSYDAKESKFVSGAT